MPKIKKKRMGWVMDMTPLVDITFLLLTFLMFTAKFKTEDENQQNFKIERPVASADTAKLADKNIATIKIDIDDETKKDTLIYFGFSEKSNVDKIYELRNAPELELTPDQLKKLEELKTMPLVVVDTTMLGKLIRMTANQKGKDIFWALDADKQIDFKKIWKVMTIMQKNNARVFHYVTTKQK